LRAVVRVCGVDAEAVGRELHGKLMATAGATFDVERVADPVAVVGLVLAGVQTVKTLWDWWTAARSRRVSVTLVLDNGRVVALEGIEREELEALSHEGP